MVGEGRRGERKGAGLDGEREGILGKTSEAGSELLRVVGGGRRGERKGGGDDEGVVDSLAGKS